MYYIQLARPPQRLGAPTLHATENPQVTYSQVNPCISCRTVYTTEKKFVHVDLPTSIVQALTVFAVLVNIILELCQLKQSFNRDY